MKNAIKKLIVIYLFFVVSLKLWSQSFELPAITNTVNSVEVAVRELVLLARNMGNPDYKGDWNSSQELFQRDIIAYLDSVLVNMNYVSVRNYVRLIRANIDRIDMQMVSRNQMINFENQLHHVFPNDGYEVRAMQTEYITKPYPFTLNRDENAITELVKHSQEYEQNLRVYQTQLDALPTIAQLNNRLQEIRRELLSPNVAQSTRLTRQLEDEEAAIERQKPEIDRERGRLTKLISDTRTQIQRSNVDDFVRNMDVAERNRVISSVWTSLYDFYEWEKFFNNENNCLKDFFILRDTKQKLFKLLDNIPQGQVQSFRSRLDAFCVGWGI